MRNIKLTIEYDGTNYNGWQTQRHKSQSEKRKTKTIQETIEKALRRILQEKVKLIGSGRTDAGAHAQGQVANFKTSSKRAVKQIKRGLNAVLPKDIVIKDARGVNLDFHSRYDAKSKIYRYAILNRPYRSAFQRRYAYLVTYKLNLALMKRESKCLVGRRDFKAFQAADKKDKSSIRRMKHIKIVKKNDFIYLDFEADGFLFKMVRNITRTLIEIARGRFKKGRLKRILRSKDRRLAGQTAPAKGLCLLKVNY